MGVYLRPESAKMGATTSPSHQRQEMHLKQHLWAAVSQRRLLRVIVLQFCILWLSSSLCIPSSHLRTSVCPLTLGILCNFHQTSTHEAAVCY